MKKKKKVKALIEATVIVIEQQSGEIELIEVVEATEFIETLQEIDIISEN